MNFDALYLGIIDPNLALLCIVIGILGIYAEFSSPGMILPGVGGATMALLGLSKLVAQPLDWRGGALIFTALVAIALDAKLRTLGALTLAGALALPIGCVLLARGIQWGTAFAAGIPFAIVTGFLLSVALRARSLKAGS